jgi:3'-5' exoribonuclease
MELKIINEKFMISDLNENLTRDNKPFIRFVLFDSKNKQYNAIMFNVKDLKFSPEKGDVVMLNGLVQNYNGQVQIKINEMEKLEGSDYFEFIPKSEYDLDEMLENLKKVIFEHLTNGYFVKLAELFFNDRETVDLFKKSPAAKSIHHAYIGGLLEHTFSVVRLSVILSTHYKVYINRDLLLMGALFHDLGKIYELHLKGGINYTDKGKLVGHLLMGIEKIESYVNRIENFPEELEILLVHMVASHHGSLEFGSPKRPKTYEAMLLYFIDDLDAKMNSINSIFTKEGIEDGWSSFDRSLDRQLYRHKIKNIEE